MKKSKLIFALPLIVACSSKDVTPATATTTTTTTTTTPKEVKQGEFTDFVAKITEAGKVQITMNSFKASTLYTLGTKQGDVIGDLKPKTTPAIFQINCPTNGITEGDLRISMIWSE